MGKRADGDSAPRGVHLGQDDRPRWMYRLAQRRAPLGPEVERRMEREPVETLELVEDARAGAGAVRSGGELEQRRAERRTIPDLLERKGSGCNHLLHHKTHSVGGPAAALARSRHRADTL